MDAASDPGVLPAGVLPAGVLPAVVAVPPLVVAGPPAVVAAPPAVVVAAAAVVAAPAAVVAAAVLEVLFSSLPQAATTTDAAKPTARAVPHRVFLNVPPVCPRRGLRRHLVRRGLEALVDRDLREQVDGVVVVLRPLVLRLIAVRTGANAQPAGVGDDGDDAG